MTTFFGESHLTGKHEIMKTGKKSGFADLFPQKFL